MANINFEFFLGNFSFVILFSTMILYWVQAVFFIIPKFHFIIFYTTLSANLSLLILLMLRWFNYSHFPLSNLYESLLFLSWSFTLIQIFFMLSKSYFNTTNFNVVKYRVENQSINENSFYLNNSSLNLNASKTFTQEFRNIDINTIIGTVLSPIALFTNSFATFSLPKNMQKAQALVPALQSNWLMMHVTVMMLSYAALLCGSLLAITFLAITWNTPPTDNQQLAVLQNNSNTKFFDRNNESLIKNQELPINLLANTLDNLSYRILGIGFPLLTVGILSGAVWANEAWGSYWSWDPKETWAFITWLIFAIYLHMRITKSWKGKKPAILASCGFFIVWICYLGVNILGTGLHSYGWIKLGG